MPNGVSAVVSGGDVMKREVYAISRVVCDVRFAPSVEFGLEAERLGAEVVRIHGDITDFWFNDLSFRWKEGPMAVAGLTAHGPIFCLERFAWDHRMRVVFRGDHRFLASGAGVHSITGPADTVAKVSRRVLDRPGWARHLAHLVTACGSVPPECVLDTISTSENGPITPAEDLVSWVIAAVAR
jgi:hypothetical protein